MKTKRTNAVKKGVDAGMTVLLLLLMAYQVTGETLHEWFGIGMTVLLIVHHILNRRWYASLFKGTYNAVRIVTVVLNTLLLLSIALTALCGMAMSAHAVPFLYGFLPVSFARRFHLSMSYWSFVLMGLHLGLHVPAMATGLPRKGTRKAVAVAVYAAVAVCGCVLFFKSGMMNYLLFRTPFALFDFDKSAVRVFAEYAAILVAFAALGTGCAVLLRRRKKGAA